MQTAPAPSLQMLARAALAVLARRGGSAATLAPPDRPALRVSYQGPVPAAAVPDAIVPPNVVPDNRSWVGAHRLTIKAPLIVFDIAWNAGEPLRIMTFSRGDWERELMRLAG